MNAPNTPDRPGDASGPQQAGAALDDADALATRQRLLLDALTQILPANCILHRREDTTPYECDGLAAYRRVPLAVVLPESESQV